MEQLLEISDIAIPLKGFLRFQGAETAIVGLRRTYTERGDHRSTTMPAISDSALTAAEPVFTFFVSGGGYTTEFIGN